MKTTILLTALLSLSLTAFADIKVSVGSGSGGKVGSGSNSKSKFISQSNIDSQNGNVVINYDSSVPNDDEIVIYSDNTNDNINIGFNPSKFMYYYYDVDTSGNPIKGSLNGGHLKINEPSHIQDGPLIIQYGASIIKTTKLPGRALILNLKSIILEHMPYGKQVVLSNVLSSESDMDLLKLLTFTSMQEDDTYVLKTFCYKKDEYKNPNAKYSTETCRQLTSALKESNYKKLPVIAQFGKNWAMYDFVYNLVSQNSKYIVESNGFDTFNSNGTYTIFVLPGTYTLKIRTIGGGDSIRYITDIKVD